MPTLPTSNAGPASAPRVAQEGVGARKVRGWEGKSETKRKRYKLIQSSTIINLVDVLFLEVHVVLMIVRVSLSGPQTPGRCLCSLERIAYGSNES